jgi:hypothetical protein
LIVTLDGQNEITPVCVGHLDRDQNINLNPYREVYGAATLISDDLFQVTEVAAANCQRIPASRDGSKVKPHPNLDQLVLFVIKAADMMTLAHELYRRAADEA